jgi:hypothetical protein
MFTQNAMIEKGKEEQGEEFNEELWRLQAVSLFILRGSWSCAPLYRTSVVASSFDLFV